MDNDPHSLLAVVEIEIDDALRRIESRETEPDWWEAEGLLCAIALARGGMYSAAAVYVKHAMTPENDRSPQDRPRGLGAPPSLALIAKELQDLRDFH